MQASLECANLEEKAREYSCILSSPPLYVCITEPFMLLYDVIGLLYLSEMLEIGNADADLHV